MPKLCDLQVHVNGQQIFVLKEKVVSKYCGSLKKIVNQHKRKSQIKNLDIEINDFPGGPDGFELVSRFCYNNGKIPITPSNVPLLHCCAVYLGMTEEVFSNNLLQQTETFLEGIYYWEWHELISSLKSCELFYSCADSCGLLEKLIFALLAKLAQNSDINLIATMTTSSSSSSSPEANSVNRFFSPSAKTTPEITKSPFPSSSRAWWYDDLTILPPLIIEKLLQTLGVQSR
ncbi:hypothetical protein L6164_001011 [Bauhinia variegata]|uniref:Uncharacterized protein n=1 Tax=Bauhinia variegata TaxID=167791 RepID=A0ACB9Q8E9_BAUVA|nr:hypothetical protein L6164_001011 [Bauhinia variegata]